MGNNGTFKEKYRATWEDSNKKEEQVKAFIESRTPFQVQYIGFGAGKTEYIKGDGKDNGHFRSAADLKLVGTKTEIEVSGPLKKLPLSRPIWISKAKLAYARAHPSVRYIFAHVNGPGGTMRFIHIGRHFLSLVRKNYFRSVQFENGMIEVPVSDLCVMNQTDFEIWIKKFGSMNKNG